MQARVESAVAAAGTSGPIVRMSPPDQKSLPAPAITSTRTPSCGGLCPSWRSGRRASRGPAHFYGLDGLASALPRRRESQEATCPCCGLGVEFSSGRSKGPAKRTARIADDESVAINWLGISTQKLCQNIRVVAQHTNKQSLGRLRASNDDSSLMLSALSNITVYVPTCAGPRCSSSMVGEAARAAAADSLVAASPGG
jgi:hypothetical protein